VKSKRHVNSPVNCAIEIFLFIYSFTYLLTVSLKMHHKRTQERHSPFRRSSLRISALALRRQTVLPHFRFQNTPTTNNCHTPKFLIHCECGLLLASTSLSGHSVQNGLYLDISVGVPEFLVTSLLMQ